MMLSSPAFRNGETIPKKYTGESEDVSPPLKWSDVPPRTAELVLICEDPDAPQEEPWVHWLIYGISPTKTNGLVEGIGGSSTPRSRGGQAPAQGLNSFGKQSYGGPLPPRGHGVHHYHFQLYALSEASRLAPGATKDAVLKAIKDRTLAEAHLVGTYERKKSQAA